MRKLLVATHGRFASGIMETFKLIMGENEDISEISAYVEPGFDMQKEAEKKIHELNEEDELIIVADIMGGSIANTFSSYIQSIINLTFLIYPEYLFKYFCTKKTSPLSDWSFAFYVSF